MRVVTDLPRPVRVVDHVWIPMPDGIRLGARIWLPADAEDDPVPAILEYIPYRKGDGTAVRDHPRHTYFAGHGYAVLRVDIRGVGRVRRDPSRRVPVPGAGGCARDPALDSGAAVVHGRCRHVRHLMGRLQRPTGRGPRTARAEDGDQPLLDGRPLRRRRPLPRRLRARAGDALVGCLDAVVQRHPARPRGRRRGVARAVARAHRQRGPVRARVARATSAATTTGSRARSARTTRRSNARSTRSAAGRTATPRRSSAW